MNWFNQKWPAGSWSFTEVLNLKAGVHWMVRVQTIEMGKMAHTMFLTPWVPQNHNPRQIRDKVRGHAILGDTRK